MYRNISFAIIHFMRVLFVLMTSNVTGGHFRTADLLGIQAKLSLRFTENGTKETKPVSIKYVNNDVEG